MTTQLTWQWQNFAELTPATLYQCLQLRSTVFIVEQHCPYQDLDGKDSAALHLLGWADGQQSELIAYARLLLPPDNASVLSFGRIVVNPRHRAKKYGEQLVAQVLEYIRASSYHGEPIVISAQHYLVTFYSKFGFKTVGQPYDEDGIPHIKMIL